MAEALLKDLPAGPLDEYRKLASFNWKTLVVFIEGEENVKLKVKAWDLVAQNPLFTEPLPDESIDAIHRRSYLQKRSMRNMFPVPGSCALQFHSIIMTCSAAAWVQYSIDFTLFHDAMLLLGTARHQPFVRASEDLAIVGSFSATEIAHGSNVAGMQTTATYEPSTQEFVINTPDFLAAKCWSSGLSLTCTHTIIFARLITPDAKDHGIHLFVVPIRNPETMLTYPGLTVGAMGAKVGLHGIDNGFVLFHSYRIPRVNLLNKFADVTPDGEYVSSLPNAQQNLSRSLSMFIYGRLGVFTQAYVALGKAITIAVRYAAVRKQFSSDETSRELSLLEYPTHQWRLFPFLAGAYALRVFMHYLDDVAYGDGKPLARYYEPELERELQVVASAGKAMAAWFSQRAIQECREACGGHGYLKSAGFGDLRDDTDPTSTYEGDNTMLLQKASAWLLKLWMNNLQGKPSILPMGSVDFIADAAHILNTTGNTVRKVEEIIHPDFIFKTYRWLNCWLLNATFDKFQRHMQTESLKSAFNKSQVFHAYPLSLVYFQYFLLRKFHEKIQTCDDVAMQQVLSRLFSLYGLWSLEKHLGTCYQGGYFQDGRIVTLIRDAIIGLCAQIKPDAVALTDALAPPDFLLKSILGNSDGEVYKSLESELMGNKGGLERPTWWREILGHPVTLEEMQSKL